MRHILVVEDETIIRMSIAMTLEDEGFRVSEARDSADALRLLDAHGDIALIFTDVDMPGGMDGLHLSELVRVRWPEVRIIVTSGHRLVENQMLPDGARFFVKPYADDAIVSCVAELLG